MRRFSFLSLLVCVIAALACALSTGPLRVGAQAQPGIVIEVTRPDDAAVRQNTFINGYRRAISGTSMKYHSSHPDAEDALIVRARRDVHSISWETDPLPETTPGESYQFVWLAGLERQGWSKDQPSHTFEFRINSEPWFTFENYRNDAGLKWKREGRDGAELSFESSTIDKFGDVFGHMVLTLPKQGFRPGETLLLEVVGEDAESPDWYMTFQYRFNFTPRLRMEPVLLREASGSAQVLRLSLDTLSSGDTVKITRPGREPISQRLKLGGNILLLPTDVVTSETQMPVTFRVNAETIDQFRVTLKPIVRRDIYLLSYSHNDIGYTDLQTDVERKQWRNLDQALELIRKTRDFPPEARFRWNFETIWSLESWLQKASAEQKQEFFAAVKEGSLGVTALYANMLTGLATDVEMSHFFDFARRLRAEYGIEINTAATSDVPGFTWGIVPALAHSGVKYFASGPNTGDRIGYTLQAWGDKPFYWLSQSGEEKVLFWVAGVGYSSFHEGELSKLGDEKIFKLLRGLEETGYPYSIIHLPYTTGGDNGPPDPTLPEFVRHWNERHVTPRLIIATHEQMFREFEKRHGASLPTYAGDFTPYWEDGAASTALETAMARAAVSRLVQAEALWAIYAPETFPERKFAEAWRNIAFWDEHTWGADKSVTDPDLPFVKGQWEFKRQFAVRADQQSRELLSRILASPVAPGTKQPANEIAIDVYNTTSWPRTDVVFLSEEQSSIGDGVVDAAGKLVPSQRLTDGRLAILASEIPPMAAKRFVVRKGNSYASGAAKAAANRIENNILAVVVNEKTGAIESLRWKTTGAELVDRTKRAGLNQYLYVAGRNPENARGLTNVKVSVKEHGALVASSLVEADAPGAKHYSSEIRAVSRLPRVDIVTTIDKLAVREKEGVHIAFPFAVPGGTVRYDVASGIVRAEADQLPGACKNFSSVESWVDVSNADYGVTWATPDAPLFEIGGINAELPWMRTLPPTQAIYSYVMNNYWHTNYKADQEGSATFRYSLMPHAAFRPDAAARFGRERREPLIAMVADPASPPPTSLFRIEPAGVLVSSVKPIAGGGAWLLYLYNSSASAQKVKLAWRDSLPIELHRSDPSGAELAPLAGEFALAAYGTAHIRVDRLPVQR